MSTRRNAYIYLLRSKADYEAGLRAGFIDDASLKTSGFIHASPQDQLTRVANKYYRSITEVICCVIETAKVDAVIKWEPATGGLYPHIYGPLNMDAVAWVVPLVPGADGKFNIEPAALSRPDED